MRIGIDIRSLIEPFPSGISEYTYQVVRRLLRQDQENNYILFYNACGHSLTDKYRIEFEKNGAIIKATRWPNKIFNFLLFLNLFIRFDKLIGKVDIFFMPNINFIALSPSTKVVLTVHDLSYEYPGYFSIKSKYWHKFIRPKRLIQKASKIIAVSQNTKQDIIDNYKIREDNIKVVYSGVNIKNFADIQKEQIEKVKEKFGINKQYYLYLGNLENRKNINTIIKAWKNFKNKNNADAQLVLAGKKSTKINYQEVDNLVITGYFREEDKPAIYAGAKAFIYPSFYEGFGLPVIEAMAAGCPVITSFSTSLPEIAKKAAILVDPYNISESVKALEIINDDNIRQDLINKGLEVASNYSWEDTATNTIKILNSLK